MVMLVGQLTKDASIQTLKDGRQVVNFDLAINDYYKSKNREVGVRTTTYINCAYWLSPKIASLLTKGSIVQVDGGIYVDAYTMNDGTSKGVIRCHVDAFKVHQSSKKENRKETVVKEQAAEDLPF